MQTCPRCKHSNRDGELVCQYCRQPFSNYNGLATRQMRAALAFDDEPTVNFDVPAPKATRNKITIEVSDVDLAPFHAFSKGVSSLHASIFRADDQINISDLGSTNGTYLNREGLVPHQAYELHNGDLIYLGQMAIRVYF